MFHIKLYTQSHEESFLILFDQKNVIAVRKKLIDGHTREYSGRRVKISEKREREML